MLAALTNDWTTIKAKVRTDTNNPNSKAVIEELIKDNVIRGQHDDLTLARCYRELKRLSGSYGEGGPLRDRLADRLNCPKSGRTLERLKRLLDLPTDIQELYSRRKLSQSDAMKILNADRQTQEKVYARLRKGHLIKFALEQEGVIKSVNPRAPDETFQSATAKYRQRYPRSAKAYGRRRWGLSGMRGLCRLAAILLWT